MKKPISLPRMIAIEQAVMFIIVVGLIVLIGIYFGRQAREDVRISAQEEIESMIRVLDSRLDADALQVKEMLLTVMNQSRLWSGSGQEKYFDKMTIRNAIQDKTTLYEDMEFLFVYKNDDFYLGNMTPRTGSEMLAYREYVEQNVEDLAAGSGGDLWIFGNVDGIDYCFLVYHYARADFYVGMGMRCEELFADMNTFFENRSGWMTAKDSNGTESIGVERIARSGWGDKTLEISGASEAAGLSFAGVITVNEVEFMQKYTLVCIVLLAVLCACSIIVQYVILRKTVAAPVIKLSNAVKSAAEEGGSIEKIKVVADAFTEEVYTLQKTLNFLLKEVISVRLQLYERKVQEQDTELRLLRAQLRPHFYLNALMTVSSMTYQERGEDIRKYLNRLSDHMRYMMQLHRDKVCLQEELAHIGNYVEMQEIKFPSSVVFMSECPKELERLQVPHLILYTIVENAFKYAMNLQDTLVLLIVCEEFCEEDFCGYRIILEDNGKGFDEETLQLYNGEEILEDKERKHIGLSNIKRSLYLQYGCRKLLQLSNVSPHGAKIEVFIPKEEKSNGVDCISGR